MSAGITAPRAATKRLLQANTWLVYGFFYVPINAWIGNREAVNIEAAEIDQYPTGTTALWQLVHWCQCGAPWDLEATPNFAARIAEANVTWPPVTPLQYPLKDW